VLGNEVCDDDEDDNIGCATGCLSINPLYICPTPGGPTTASVCVKICSNSNLDEGEECDDSNGLDGDGCS
jgi:cysteine-rich repeat protein